MNILRNIEKAVRISTSEALQVTLGWQQYPLPNIDKVITMTFLGNSISRITSSHYCIFSHQLN